MENEFVDRAQLEKLKKASEKAASKKKVKKASKSKGKQSSFVQILNGDFLKKDFILKNLNFLFFIILLLLLIVGKGYYGKQITKSVNQTQKELDEMTGEYFEVKARLEENTRRSTLLEELESTGLKETTNPPKVIRIKKDKVEQ